MKRYIVFALLSVFALGFVACNEEFVEPTPTPNVKPAISGDQIIFGARAGFENSNPDYTRTVYTGETYTENGKTYERIEWDYGNDHIEIYCEEAHGDLKTSHYTVYSDAEDDADDGTKSDKAYLARMEQDDVALSWGNGEEHTFYAVYPSSRMNSTLESASQNGIFIDPETLKMTGIIYHDQSPTEQPTADANGNYVIAPRMEYAYMVAKEEVKKSECADGVGLTFVPIVTAVEVELVAQSEDIEIQSLHLANLAGVTGDEIGTKGIAGKFTVDVGTWNPSSDSPALTCANINDEWASNVINVVLTAPITIQPTKSVKFTVFMRAGVDISNLQVRITPDLMTVKSQTIEDLTIPKGLKTNIKGVKLPETKIEPDASKWMAQMNPNTPISRLSIPGSAGSCSYLYTSGDNPENYRSQETTMTITKQWEAGIRAFEIVSNRAWTSGFLGYETSQTALTNITCNGTDLGISVTNAMNEIVNCLKANPDELAVVTMVYQPTGQALLGAGQRNGNHYVTSFNKWYDAYANRSYFQKYEEGMTLGEAKGTILLFLRANQRHEGSDNFATMTTTLGTRNAVLIDGCGTAKDKWYSRGYKISDASDNDLGSFDISNDHGSESSDVDSPNLIEYYMKSKVLFENTDSLYATAYTATNSYKVTRPAVDAFDNLNMTYSTSAGISVIYQDWARVVGAPVKNYAYSDTYGSGNIYWFESLSEKKWHITKTFEKALNSTDASQFFFNSLSGYLTTVVADGASGSDNSLKPSVDDVYGGSGGNIKGLAEVLIPHLTTYVLEQANSDEKTGPTGVVVMDYVDLAGDLIQAIVLNNYKTSTGLGSWDAGTDDDNTGDGI